MTNHAVRKSVASLRRVFGPLPRVAVVLGSGFAHVLDGMTVRAQAPFHKLPGFPTSSVPGHPTSVVVTEVADRSVVFLCGRSHYYEGHDLRQVTFPIRALAACGVDTILLTNAAGGIHPSLRQGDFMAIADHINFMGANPLRGGPGPAADRFVDLSQAYDPELLAGLRRSARAVRARCRPGVYLAVSGPSYETPAEIRAFRALGADAVGMSTVPETIVARQCGMRVAGLSFITNLAAGRAATKINHGEVLDATASARAQIAALIIRFLADLPC